jgi:hypothetical protein
MPSGEEMQFEIEVLKSDGSKLHFLVTIRGPKGSTLSTNVFLGG